MKFLTTLKKKPWVAHLLRAVARFGDRMGAQFAAAITYFSVLAVVPILMVAFAAIGFTVTAINPDMLTQLEQTIMDKIGSGSASEAVQSAVTNALSNWGSIGAIGLLSALYAGAGWVNNLKTAIRAQWRPELEPAEKKRNIVMETLVNIAELLGLLATGGLAVAASIIGSALNTQILHLLHLDAVPGSTFLTWLATFVVSVLTSTLMFLYLFRVLPLNHVPKRQWLIGSVLAGAVLAVLLTFTGLIFRLFQGNAAAAAFGNVIVVMLAFNLFAQITLFIASWIATTNQPAVARTYNEADEPLRHRSDVETAEDHWAAADEDRREKEAKKNGVKPGEQAPEDRSDSARTAYARQQARKGLGPQVPQNDPATMVPQDVAARGVRAGMGAGYVVGAATGIGLGAVVARAVSWFAHRKD